MLHVVVFGTIKVGYPRIAVMVNAVKVIQVACGDRFDGMPFILLIHQFPQWHTQTVIQPRLHYSAPGHSLVEKIRLKKRSR